MYWFLDEPTFRAMEQFRVSRALEIAEGEQKWLASRDNGGAPGSNIMDIQGSTARIDIRGPMTNKPSFWAMLFGSANTVYSDIIAAVDSANNNADVKEIVLDVDTPGGTVAGFFETQAVIADSKKPIRTEVRGQATSGGYGLAASTSEIRVQDRASAVGSVGVVSTHYVSDRVVKVTSTEAPNKAPDLTTEEGKAAERETLDQMHDLFTEGIADGRTKATGKSYTQAKVNKQFGRGGIVLADLALEKGMIDAIGLDSGVTPPGESGRDESAQNQTAHGGGESMEERTDMKLSELQAAHPEVYAEAVQVGVTQANKQAKAHITMGRAAGDLELACGNIEKGVELDAAVQAEYMAAGMRNKETANREADEAATGAAAAGAEAAADAGKGQNDEQDRFNKALAGHMGVSLDA